LEYPAPAESSTLFACSTFLRPLRETYLVISKPAKLAIRLELEQTVKEIEAL
jgi:hypothetical protein